MSVDPADYEELEPEELTVVSVTSSRADEVLATLQSSAVPLGDTSEPDEDDEYTRATWFTHQLGPDVVAVEYSGYHDPSVETLAALSAVGRRAAVARSNIDAQVRFGCAEDGRVLFDDDEFAFAEDRSGLPAELSGLMDAVWVDLDAEESHDDGPAPMLTALAMAETFTGVRPLPTLQGD